MLSDRLKLHDVRSTTPFRLTLLMGALLLAGIVATLGPTYLLTARELTARSDRILYARARSLLATPRADLPVRIRTEITNAAAGFSYFALESRDGELVVGNIRVVAPKLTGQPFDVEASAGQHGPVRVLTVRNADGEMIVLGRDTTQIWDLRHRLLTILLVSGVASTLLVLGGAVVLSIPPLRRVRDLQRASRAIVDGDLAVRMPIAGRHDELDQFAGTVNLMVEEVGHVIAQVKSATDAIAHDLRTPLTRVRASLHRARQRHGLSPEQTAITERALADLDQVIDRFGALLRISELEASGRRSGLAPLDLDDLLNEVVDLYQPLADERGIALHLSTRSVATIDADRGLLFEAIGNLVDNAIKFAASRVVIRVGERLPGPVLEVLDDGPGIPPDERGAVLRRFHRARGAAGVEGTGLGLAVVSAILHLHGFALEFGDARPGLIARVVLSVGAPE